MILPIPRVLSHFGLHGLKELSKGEIKTKERDGVLPVSLFLCGDFFRNRESRGGIH